MNKVFWVKRFCVFILELYRFYVCINKINMGIILKCYVCIGLCLFVRRFWLIEWYVDVIILYISDFGFLDDNFG